SCNFYFTSKADIIALHSFPTRRSSDLPLVAIADAAGGDWPARVRKACVAMTGARDPDDGAAEERILADLYAVWGDAPHLPTATRSEEHTSELQSRENIVCRLLHEKKHH